MRRREFIGIAGGAAVWPLAAHGQQKATPVIGLLRLAPGDPTDTFRHYMQRDGWEKQHNLRLLVVSAEGDRDRVVAAARELASQNPDVIIVFGDPATRAVQQATPLIPIVAMTDDMLGSGLVASMARPGGNTTGISIFASELDVKRLELLHELVPQAARIGILADTSTVSTRPQLEIVAGRLGIGLVIRSGANPDEVGRAAEQLAGTGVDAVNVLASPVIATAHKAIIDRLNGAGLPAIYQWLEYAEAGGLLGYGPSFPACYRQVAALAGKSLNEIRVGTDGTVEIGAMVRLAELQRSAEVRSAAPVIADTLLTHSNVRVRNVATLGGNLAHADPHMDLPPVLIALDARVRVIGPAGEREIAVEGLSSGYLETVLANNELIASVIAPAQPGRRAAYFKCTARSADDWPALGLAVSFGIEDGIMRDPRIAIGAATETPLRLRQAEALLAGRRSDDPLLHEAGRAAAAEAPVIADHHGSAAYKRVLVEVYLRRALQEALAGAAA